MIPVPQSTLETLAGFYGTIADHLKYFGGGREESDGVVYVYPSVEGQRLLKILAVPLENQRKGILAFEARLQFMRFLGENGARIVFPKFSPQGNLYETTQAEDHIWIGYSMDIVKGRAPKEKTWDERFFMNWGQTIGQIHHLAQEYPIWRSSVDPENGETFLSWEGEWEGFYRWCQEEDVRKKWVEIGQQLEALPITRDTFGLIHNDPHIWNLRVNEDQVTLLDFDVANHHWFVNDIAIACQNILIFMSGGLNSPVRDRKKLLKFIGCFMKGYARENQLPEKSLYQLELFIAYRRILLFIVMQDWALSRPGLYTSWKQLILSPPLVVGSKEF